MTSSRTRAGTRLPVDLAVLDSEPPLGNFMFLIAVAMERLDVRSSGMRISRFLDDELRINTSPAQIYGALQRMQSSGWVGLKREVKSKYGPPQKIYELTEDGKAAVLEKAAHIAALNAFVDRYYVCTALTGIVGANQNIKDMVRGDRSLATEQTVRPGALRHARKKHSPVPPHPHQGRTR